jgi:hypothetical protein
VQSVLADLGTSGLSPAEKALFELVRQANGASYEIVGADVERVKSFGWSDEALYDAITVCALFNFYNRWCDAAGVHPMPPEAHEVSGKRLAEHGYVFQAAKEPVASG